MDLVDGTIVLCIVIASVASLIGIADLSLVLYCRINQNLYYLSITVFVLIIHLNIFGLASSLLPSYLALQITVTLISHFTYCGTLFLTQHSSSTLLKSSSISRPLTQNGIRHDSCPTKYSISF